MNQKDYIKFHEDFCEKIKELNLKKNKDYTGSSADPFFNFTQVEKLGICSTEQGFLARMMDKMSRLSTLVRSSGSGGFEIKDETALDTLQDLANYCILFAAYLETKKLSNKGRVIWVNNDTYVPPWAEYLSVVWKD